MTLIAGFNTSTGGLLICADREEGGGFVAKRSVNKIERVLGVSGYFTIAGAGRTSILVNTFQRIAETVSGIRDGAALYRDHQKILSGVLKTIHEDFVWSRPTDTNRSMSLIIGASFFNEHRNFLYSTEEEVLQLQQTYCFDGYGRDMGYYFADRLWHPTLSYPELLLLATFIFREVGDAVREVGKGTDMWVIQASATTGYMIPHTTLKTLEDQLPQFDEAITHFWKDKAKVPDWLKEQTETHA